MRSSSDESPLSVGHDDIFGLSAYDGGYSSPTFLAKPRTRSQLYIHVKYRMTSVVDSNR